MIESLKHCAAVRGERLAVLQLSRLDEAAAELATFAASEKLNGFQQWIVAHKYRLSVPDNLPFAARSILLQALPHSFFARVTVEHAGQAHQLRCLVKADFEAGERWLHAALSEEGCQLQAEANLPMKRLGAHSLAAYGRNNITYIEGLGSSFSYAGYFSDLNPDAQDDWLPQMRLVEDCEGCTACLNSCPSGAIRPERFLIDNERCLSYFNEVPDPFPAWIALEWHNSLYDCLLCQGVCPMNHGRLTVASDNYHFDEAITEQILSGAALESFSSQFQADAQRLGLDEWWGAIGKNLAVLLGIRF